MQISDSHIHIGQFHDVHYDPLEILQIVAEQGIKHCVYSSTTSGEPNVKYSKIEKEISAASKAFPHSKFKPYLWYVTDYIKKGITAKNAFENLPYKGIKLHPKWDIWNFSDKNHLKTLRSLFSYAAENNIPVLIHSGPDPSEKPEFFERFFIEYPSVKFTLAHCRPVYETIAMFALYKNIYGDTAFLPEDDLRKIVKAGFGKRIIFGSDFPITHYFATRKWSLRKQYAHDVEIMEKFCKRVWRCGFAGTRHGMLNIVNNTLTLIKYIA
jgi:predicted TIM-barrel fold metal-dependent hydrolase